MIEPTYTIDQAVKDKAVVPLLYEGRLVLQQVDQKAMDKWFEVVTKPLTAAQRADLKKKFASADQFNKAERKITRWLSTSVSITVRTGRAPDSRRNLPRHPNWPALKYKKFLDEFGKVIKRSDHVCAGYA